MTLTILRERETTTADSVRVPYFVLEQDEGLTLDRNGARDAAINQATIDAGLVPTDFAARQLSNRAWRLEAIFDSARPSKRTLEAIGDIEIGFRYQAESELVKHSKNTVRAGGIDGSDNGAPRFGNLVGVQGGQWGSGLKHTGIQITPRVTNWIRATVPNGTITEDYEKQIGDVMGHVNSIPYRGKPANTLRFVSCTSTIRSDADMQINFGFDYRARVPIKTIPAIDTTGAQTSMIVPGYPGHFLFWTYDEVYVDDNWYSGPLPIIPRQRVLAKQAMFWYIERVHEESNFSLALGI